MRPYCVGIAESKYKLDFQALMLYNKLVIRKDTMEDDLVKQQIDNSFDGVEVVSLKTTFGKINLVSLSELPLSTMIDFAKTPNEEKTAKILKLLKTCLVDPMDWDKIENQLTTREAMSLIPQWMAKSSDDSDEFEYDTRNGKVEPDESDEDEDSL
jgi:hypothetical protein